MLASSTQTTVGDLSMSARSVGVTPSPGRVACGDGLGVSTYPPDRADMLG